MPEVILGIDLGTTFSCVAYVNENGDVVRIQIGNEGALPSVVRIVNGEVEVGEAAMNQWGIDKDHVIRWVKRSMGNPSFLYADLKLFELSDGLMSSLEKVHVSKEAGGQNVMAINTELRKAFAVENIELGPKATLYEVGKNRSYNLINQNGTGGYCIRKEESTGQWSVLQGWSAVAISAEILKEIKRYAERQLGKDVVVSKAVITCPAYFNANEIDATYQAGVLAGFEVQEVVKEPVAAGVYHATGKLKAGQRLLVCDLGGGTFDATILKIHDNGSFEPVHTRGNRRLGGHDWTAALKEWMAKQYEEAHEEDLTLDTQTDQRLYQDAETVKQNLASMPQTTAVLQGKSSMGSVVVTREKMSELTVKLIDMVTHKLDEVLAEATSEKADGKNRIGGWEDIDLVLLVGGSSRLLTFQEAVEAKTGKKPEITDEPDLAVAYGAAVLAAGRFRPTLPTDGMGDEGGLVAGGKADEGGLYCPTVYRTTPRRLGTRAYDAAQGKAVTAEIIPQGTETPAQCRVDQFSAPAGDFVDIPVVEFDNEESGDYECIKSYRCGLDDQIRMGDQIGIEFHYDKSGRTSLTAHHLKTGRSLPVEDYDYVEPKEVTTVGKPWTVLFALDISWSMEGEELRNAKDALVNSVRHVLSSSGTKAGIVLFGSRATVLCPPTDNADEIITKIKKVQCQGTTNMSGALAHCRDLLEHQPDSVDKEIALLTDGLPDSTEETLDEARRVADAGITLSALAIGGDVDTEFLREMTPNVVVALKPRDIAGELGGMLTRR